MAQETLRKLIPIGIDDYKKLIEGNRYYVDKTLLIAEIWQAGQVVLMPRPRRFGKTLNLSMIRYFFEKSETDNTSLFAESKLLTTHPQYHDLMGKYPVIFLTFKDIGRLTWTDMYEQFRLIITAEFVRHNHIFSSIPNESEKKLFKNIENGTASNAEFATSIKFLSHVLHQHFGQEAIILIDEYDAPLHTAYNNNFYEQAIDFMRTLLSSALKSNPALHRGFLTGILTVAKEGIFSGLNNLDVFDITQNRAARHFGFTQDETDVLLKYYNMDENTAQVKAWYDGYRFGTESNIYNPWSVLKYIQNEGDLEMYWVNTGQDTLIKKLLAKATHDVKEDMELLLKGEELKIPLEKSITMPDLDKTPEPLWSLLLFAGYLTYSGFSVKDEEKIYSLRIPNKELTKSYFKTITSLFTQVFSSANLQSFINALITGDAKRLTNLMQEFIQSSVSAFDIPQKDTERSYHLFVLGLLVCLRDQYIVKSNRESGYGRYDIMLIPKDKNKTGIIIEFKKSDYLEELSQSAQEALEQIKAKNYAQELNDLGIANHQAYGMAFYRKDVVIKMA